MPCETLKQKLSYTNTSFVCECCNFRPFREKTGHSHYILVPSWCCRKRSYQINTNCMPYFIPNRNWVELCSELSVIIVIMLKQKHDKQLKLPICSLTLITCLTVLFNILYNSNPVKPFSYFSKGFISSKVSTSEWTE